MGFIGNIIYGVMSNKEKVERCQKNIREAEWKEIKAYIKPNSSFIDVGCGAGYTLKKVIDVYNCDAIGIDPVPGEHGVGRYSVEKQKNNKIIRGSAENIPFRNCEFDIIYSSHVLEHVNNEMKSLSEMKRILKDDGILILGVPTALMAWIALVSQLIFTTHIRIYNFIRHFFSNQILKNLVQIFFINRIVILEQKQYFTTYYITENQIGLKLYRKILR